MSAGSQRTTVHGRGFEARGGAVFAFEPELHDLELQRADGGEQRRLDRRVAQVKRLDDAFLQQLVEALAELFELRRVRIVQVAEGFGREARDFLVEDRRVGRQRVADAEAVVADQADDVAGKASSTVSRSLPKSLCELERRTFFSERE